MASNRLSGAEAMVSMLQAHGVRDIFGLCGDTSLPFYDALQRMDHGMRHILTRDERSASYMADGYARVTGRVGVCEGPSGGGATYILPGLVEANESSVPILAITSDVATSSVGRYALTDLDQEGLFRPVTQYTKTIPSAELLPRLVRAAFRTMTTPRPGSAQLGLPFDVQRQATSTEEVWADARFGEFPALPGGADPQAVEELLSALLTAERPAIICGGGVIRAGGEAELLAFAESLDLPVATTVSGQGTIAETHALSVGVVGSNGGIAATRELIDESDLILFIGCRAGSVTTERWRSPTPECRILHIDCDPNVISANYRTEAAISADARLALAALNQASQGLLPNGRDYRFGGAKRAGIARAAKAQVFSMLASSNETPIRPERVIAECNAVLPDNAIVVADPGTACPYFSAFYTIRASGPDRFISNRAHGALGYALNAAIGVQIARPQSRVIAAMGDGGFAFTCGEMETIRRLDLPIILLIFSNQSFGWIKAGQRSSFGSRFFSVDFSRSDHAAIAQAFGFQAWSVHDPAGLRPALQEALAQDEPALLDIISQPLEEANAPVSEWIA